jgi:hypothetical protein
MKAEQQHRTHLLARADVGGAPFTWQARCSCGWTSWSFDTKALAKAAAWHHEPLAVNHQVLTTVPEERPRARVSE